MGTFVITTGGTMGALPFEDPSRPPKFSLNPPEGNDFVRDILKTTFSSFNTRCISLEARDSKLIDDIYRIKVLSLVEEAPEKEILITHGTDAILKTADFFYQQLKISSPLKGKTIVFTGSMVPLSNGIESDGHLNLAFSLNFLSRQNQDEAQVSIVLCDFDNKGKWAPRLYSYTPNRYEKFYDIDGRHHRLIERVQAMSEPPKA